MNPRFSILLFFLVIFSRYELRAQCEVAMGAAILDNTSFSVEIFVDGAANDDLANIDQGLCGVELFFEHSSIRDISISLQSPNGDEVVLVGPATGAGGSTQFTYWGVDFIPCSGAAMPDLPILEPVFSTEDNWGIFGNYNGQYYPQQGCLEDFDFGPVNGIWTLHVEDVILFDEGMLDSVSLIFCDPTNVNCLECIADGGELGNIPTDYCEGDPNLLLSLLTPLYEDDAPPEQYDYNYIVMRNDMIIQIDTVPNLRDSIFGQYRICGLSSNNQHTEDIIDNTLNLDFDTAQSYFLSSDYCAALSSNCININIIEVPDTILRSDTICLGEVIEIDGVEYSMEGKHVIDFSESFCDSIFLLDLHVIDNQAIITASNDQISCNDANVVLDASESLQTSTTIIHWFKVDDVLDPSIASNTSITISQPGIYGLSLITGMCADTAYITITNDESIPSFTFESDTITCYNPMVNIDMTPSIALESVQWTGPLSASTEDISVGSGGTYYVEGVAANGCIGTDSIYIVENIDVYDPVLLSDTLTCMVDTVSLAAILPDSLNFAYEWLGPNIVPSTENNSTVKVLQDTTYILNLQSIDNGCIEQFSYTVEIDTFIADISIQSTDLNCAQLNAELTVSPTIDGVEYYWEDQNNMQVGLGDTISVDQGGVYQVFSIGHNGCRDSMEYMLFQDTMLPVVVVEDVDLSCLLDSVQLVASSSESDVRYQWNGPIDFRSKELNPYVNNPGYYYLTATDSSGCVSFHGVEVIPADGLPMVTFEVDTIDCNNEFVTVFPSDTTNLKFDWISTVVEGNSAFLVNVNQAGEYQLAITDTILGCMAMYEFMVEENFDLSMINYTADEISCLQSSVIITTDMNSMIDSVRWNTDFGYTSTDIEPSVDQAGDYYLTAVGLNGCIFMDTITIVENESPPHISTTVPLLDCLNPTVDISFVTDNDDDILSIITNLNETVTDNTLNVDSPGTYLAIAESINGCIDTVEMIVYQDTIAPVANIVTDGQINCSKFTSTLYVDAQEDQLEYDWSGVSIISNLLLDSVVVDSPGIYNVIVTDTASCTTALFVEIISSVEFPLVSSSSTVANCTDTLSSVMLTVPSDVSLVTWQGPSSIDDDIYEFETNVGGEYIATVTGGNNCITNHAVTVVVDTIIPVIDLDVSGILDCDTEFVTLTGSSSASQSTFLWTGSDGTTYDTSSIDVSDEGNFSLTVTAPNTCFSDTVIVVQEDTSLPSIVTGPDPTLNCEEGKLFISVETDDNVVEYLWDGPLGQNSDQELLVSVAGLYSVTVTNDLGCENSTTINVIDDTQGPVITTRDTFITCDLLPVPLPLMTTESEVSYTWEGPGFASNLESPESNTLGEYIVYAILDRNECITVDTVRLTYQEVPPTFDAIYDDINCYKPTTLLESLQVEDDSLATWYDVDYNFLASDSLSVNAEGKYNLIVIGTNACEDTLQIVVNEDFEYPEIEINLTEPFQCENLDVMLIGSILSPSDTVPTSTSWSTVNGLILSGSESATPQISGGGTYVFTVTIDENGCSTQDSIVLMQEQQSLDTFYIEKSDPNCFGNDNASILVSEVLGGYPPYQYVLSDHNVQTNGLFDNLESGVYQVQVIDSLGCKLEQEIQINEGLDFVATAELDTTIIVGDTILLNALFNVPDDEIATAIWTAHNSDYTCDDCFEPAVNPLLNTYYTLHATTVDGCQDSSRVLIRVNRNPKISIANIFAPGSENNALFYVQQTSGIEKVLSMSVFDKWASRMFFVENVAPGDPSGGWDGTFQGRYVNPGVYLALIEVVLYSGEVVNLATDITVIR